MSKIEKYSIEKIIGTLNPQYNLSNNVSRYNISTYLNRDVEIFKAVRSRKKCPRCGRCFYKIVNRKSYTFKRYTDFCTECGYNNTLECNCIKCLEMHEELESSKSKKYSTKSNYVAKVNSLGTAGVSKMNEKAIVRVNNNGMVKANQMLGVDIFEEGISFPHES